MTKEMSDNLFKSMDDDGSGMVDYRELIKGCAKLVHDATTDERFKLIFDAYDSDGGGTISATELMKIAHDKGKEMDESLELVKNVMSAIDVDGTGQVGALASPKI
jgi:Ca2+-binding EF-hand superfamily protein